MIVTQLLNNRREELRWQRDRETRSHDARATAYAEVMGVIYRVLRAEMRRDLGLDAEDLAEL